METELDHPVRMREPDALLERVAVFWIAAYVFYLLACSVWGLGSHLQPGVDRPTPNSLRVVGALVGVALLLVVSPDRRRDGFPWVLGGASAFALWALHIGMDSLLRPGMVHGRLAGDMLVVLVPVVAVGWLSGRSAASRWAVLGLVLGSVALDVQTRTGFAQSTLGPVYPSPYAWVTALSTLAIGTALGLHVLARSGRTLAGVVAIGTVLNSVAWELSGNMTVGLVSCVVGYGCWGAAVVLLWSRPTTTGALPLGQVVLSVLALVGLGFATMFHTELVLPVAPLIWLLGLGVWVRRYSSSLSGASVVILGGSMLAVVAAILAAIPFMGIVFGNARGGPAARVAIADGISLALPLVWVCAVATQAWVVASIAGEGGRLLKWVAGAALLVALAASLLHGIYPFHRMVVVGWFAGLGVTGAAMLHVELTSAAHRSSGSATVRSSSTLKPTDS